jgi:hypothetical protein
MTSVDATDERVEASGKAFYSFKFKKSGVRYEVGISIKKGDIVWIHGPYPCGDWPDIEIFRSAIVHFLEDGERVEADDGYIGEAPKYVKCPNSFTNPDDKKKMQQRVRSRHETVNKRLKQWGCLKDRFRHDVAHKHSSCFRAVAVLTQLAIEFGEPLFDVGEYSDLA